ncbi:hypothetical protein [uncultured Amnibacterium sp.]|uniref:hypothetical protein n=1 Tax=uncultured Amnibacterium sp. TaxID=1631851 RepID=UPI0035C978B1
MQSRGTVWRRRAGFVAVPLVVGLSSLLLTGADVAFSSTTSNPTSSFSAGTLNLTNNDTVTANATVTAAGPTTAGSAGATGSRCFTVTSTGSLPSTVRLYDSLGANTNSLSSYISVTISQGTGTNSLCTDFTPLASGATLYTGTLLGAGSASSFATGLGTWTPTGGVNESRDFRVDYAVSSTAPNTTQGSSTAFTLTWEAQNQ